MSEYNNMSDYNNMSAIQQYVRIQQYVSYTTICQGYIHREIDLASIMMPYSLVGVSGQV